MSDLVSDGWLGRFSLWLSPLDLLVQNQLVTIVGLCLLARPTLIGKHIPRPALDSWGYLELVPRCSVVDRGDREL